MSFERLLFGTAGVPNSTVKKNNPVEGVKKIHELGFGELPDLIQTKLCQMFIKNLLAFFHVKTFPKKPG